MPIRRSVFRRLAAGALAVLAPGLLTCGSPVSPPLYPEDPARVRFAGFDATCDGIPARMVWDHLEYGAGDARPLSEAERAGACTWYFWPGGDPLASGGSPDGSPENARGNPRFWRQAEVRTARVAEETGLRVGINLLSFLDSRRRGRRFAELGAINDPGCRRARGPDPYGLWLDECEDPYSSGVMGLRLFPNPAFDPEAWDPERFMSEDRSAAEAGLEPPYLVGMTCAACHVTFSPNHPPDDPEDPRWENLAPALGNQYLKEGKMFQAGLEEEDFLYWIYETQQAGTSDTSRISTDWINNPNAINPIFFILSHRPRWTETMNDGSTRAVPRILKDGADSIGPAGAALRVYVNIGTCPDYRAGLEDSFTGLEPQRPFRISEAEAECEDWRLTAERMADAAAFLDSVQPYRLEDAPGGGDYFTASEEELHLGRRVFGAHCARCHSSKLPPGYDHEGPEKHSESARQAWVELALREDFLQDNFLSDDRRYPLVSEDPRFAIGTNAARALATNAIEGHVWERFSSRTYKSLPSPGRLRLPDPFARGGAPAQPVEHPIPAGGPGYYRTPSLVSLWATAPFLHNNMLGLYNHDPSVAGRMEAFEDAAEKLLWPEKRAGEGSIKRTPHDTVLRLDGEEIRVPAGTPINLLAHIDLGAVVREAGSLEDLERAIHRLEDLRELDSGAGNRERREALSGLLALNRAPDLIEDRGHDSHFGELTGREKRALIEFMKTF